MGLFSKKTDSEDTKSVIGKGIKSLEGLHTAPKAIFNEGADKFAEIYGSAMVNSTRMFILAAITSLIAIACLLIVMLLLPLKQIQPWVVEVNPQTGVVNKPVEILKVTPNLAVVKAELARWAESVYTIDRIRTPSLFRYAQVRAREKAISQFTEFRIREKTFERIGRESGLSRDVQVTSVDASSQKGVAFAFITTIERAGVGSDLIQKKYRLTLHYLLEPPTQEADLLLNPLGLYVTYFNEAEERVN